MKGKKSIEIRRTWHSRSSLAIDALGSVARMVDVVCYGIMALEAILTHLPGL
jgi:hypothetical protein